MKISLPSHLSDNLIEFGIIPQNFKVFPSCLLASSTVVRNLLQFLIFSIYNTTFLSLKNKFIYILQFLLFHFTVYIQYYFVLVSDLLIFNISRSGSFYGHSDMPRHSIKLERMLGI